MLVKRYLKKKHKHQGFKKEVEKLETQLSDDVICIKSKPDT